jgi:hypothetical protein
MTCAPPWPGPSAARQLHQPVLCARGWRGYRQPRRRQRRPPGCRRPSTASRSVHRPPERSRTRGDGASHIPASRSSTRHQRAHRAPGRRRAPAVQECGWTGSPAATPGRGGPGGPGWCRRTGASRLTDRRTARPLAPPVPGRHEGRSRSRSRSRPRPRPRPRRRRGPSARGRGATTPPGCSAPGGRSPDGARETRAGDRFG